MVSQIYVVAVVMCWVAPLSGSVSGNVLGGATVGECEWLCAGWRPCRGV